MKIQCEQHELDVLTKLGCVVLVDNVPHLVSTSDTGTVHIPVDIGTELVVSKSKLDLEELYNELRKEFPSDTLKHIYNTSGGANLRSGKKSIIKKRLAEIALEYSPEDIVLAAKYEVYTRTKKSKLSATDELQYMSRLVTWVNNTNNVEAMIERFKADNEFLNILNHNNNDTRTNRHRIY